MTDLEKEVLEIIAGSIPKFPPLKPGGEVTVAEMYPDLTEEELVYIMQHYKGNMVQK
jgi:hypothetical protein